MIDADFFAVKYAGMTLTQTAECMAKLREEHTRQKAETSAIWKEHEYLAKSVLPEMMEEMGVSSLNITGLGRLELRHDASCSIPKENKGAVYDWVESNGYADLIVGTINSSTFKAQVKKWIKDGEDFPMELINFNPFENAVLVRAK